jgi:CheY-like chemotaxis protein
VANILVVDDDRATRHLLAGLLTRAGLHATQAKDGAEALKKLEDGRFDLMLLDIWMPRMTGLDLLAALRK